MIKPWKILSSKQTYKDDWLSVRTDHVQLDDGREMTDYHIMEYPDWISVFAFTDEGNIVLIREYRHGPQQITIGLPSGVIEPEQTPEDAARAELQQETGYTAREFIRIGSAYANWATSINQVHYFIAFGATPSGAQDLDANEEIEPFEWPWQKYWQQDGVNPQHCLHTAGLYYAERYFQQHPDKRPLSQYLRDDGDRK